MVMNTYSFLLYLCYLDAVLKEVKLLFMNAVDTVVVGQTGTKRLLFFPVKCTFIL